MVTVLEKSQEYQQKTIKTMKNLNTINQSVFNFYYEDFSDKVYSLVPGCSQKAPITEEQEKKAFSLQEFYSPFTTGHINFDSNDLMTYFLPDTIVENFVTTFTFINKLEFSLNQLAKIMYFYKNFPFYITDNNKISFTDSKEIQMYSRASGYQGEDSIYWRFYTEIVVPQYEKNRNRYDKVEDFFVDIVDSFNVAPTLFMTNKEYNEFLSKFETREDMDVFHNVNIAFDKDFFDTPFVRGRKNIALSRAEGSDYKRVIANIN